jgi:hypothetical protein
MESDLTQPALVCLVPWDWRVVSRTTITLVQAISATMPALRCCLTVLHTRPKLVGCCLSW